MIETQARAMMPVIRATLTKDTYPDMKPILPKKGTSPNQSSDIMTVRTCACFWKSSRTKGGQGRG